MHRVSLFNVARILGFVALMSAACFGQFSSSIQGIIEDTTGARVAGANVKASSLVTNFEAALKADDSGAFRFVSLAPGEYQVSASASGFAIYNVRITLTSGENLNLPVKLSLSNTTSTIEVTGQAPLLDTAETRNQQTVSAAELTEAPLPSRNLTEIASYAPGVKGLGVSALGNGNTDNYNWGVGVDVNANGQSANANMWVLDGLDVTDNIRPGEVDILPAPETIQETTTAVNTYSVEYGRGSSVVTTFSTKSGSNHFHGEISDYFTDQNFWARTEFVSKYAPFHSNNGAAAIGGPIWAKHKLYFFFSTGLLRSSAAFSSSTTFEDPAFLKWAQATFPSTVGTQVITTYLPSNAVTNRVNQTAQQAFGAANCDGGTPATSIPCSTPVFDNGNFSATSFKNGQMFNFRIDKDWTNDRLYGSFNRMSSTFGSPNVRPAFTTQSRLYTDAVQLNYTHTFSPSTVNEASFAYFNPDGRLSYTGDFSVPNIYVNGLGASYGEGWADGEFLQKDEHWREALTHIVQRHTLKFGYSGWHGTDVALFAPVYSLPAFQMNSLLDMVQDQPFSETDLSYDGKTGSAKPYNYGFANTIGGIFAEDTWQAKSNLTVTYGLRWDDFGNPYPMKGTELANFFPGSGATFDQQIANGTLQVKNRVLSRRLWDNWSPRIGVAWDPERNGDWVVRGGFGVYHDMPTLGNLENGIRLNPPSFAIPTFFSGSGTQTAQPIFGLGTNKSTPQGFPYPAFVASALNSAGGYVGQQVGIGGVDPNLVAPTNFNYSATIEHKLPGNLVASVGYTGVHGHNLIADYGAVGSTTFALNVNTFAGDLIRHNSSVPTGLNPNFGAIQNEFNAATSNYNAFVADLRGRSVHGLMFDISYTRSHATDNSQNYPTHLNLSQYTGPSSWDAPNRVSAMLHYTIPGTSSNRGLRSRLLNGWSINVLNAIQTGTPFTVFTSVPFNLPSYQQFASGGGPYTGGDFNADGNNYDFPDVSTYHYLNSRSAYLTGIFTTGQFTVPTTLPSEGNEKTNKFRNPGFWNTDASVSKETRLAESLSLQLRFEFLNVFNHANLLGVDGNMADGTFGRATSQTNPRYLQIGARIIF